jgi:hypothetical protein
MALRYAGASRPRLDLDGIVRTVMRGRQKRYVELREGRRLLK